MVSDIKRLFRHTSIYGFGDIVGRSISFLLVPLYTNALAKDEYGVMSLAYVFIGFVNVLYIMGLNTAFIRFFTTEKENEERKTIFSTTILFLTCTSLLASLCLWLAASPVASLLFQSEALASYIRMMAIILFVDTLTQFPMLILRALEQSKRYAAITVVRFVVTVALNLYFVLLLKKGVEGVLLSNVLASFLLFLLLLPLSISYVRRSFSLALIQRMLVFGFPLVPAVLCVLAIDLSDRYILEHFVGLEQVGVYSLGYRLGMIMTLFVSAFRIAWPPFLLTVEKQDNAKEIYAKVLTYFLLTGALVFLGVTLYLKVVLHLFVGEQYWEAAPVVPLILLSYLFYGVYVNFIVGIYIKKKTKPIPYITGFAALINIVCNFLLIPRFGMMGAASATLLAYISMALALGVLNQRMYPIAYEKLRIMKIVVAAAIVYTLSFIIPSASLGVDVVLKSLLLVGFIALLIGLRFFSSAERRSIFKMIGRTEQE